MGRNPYVCGGCERRFRDLRGFDWHRTVTDDDGCADPADAPPDTKGRARFQLNEFDEWCVANRPTRANHPDLHHLDPPGML